MNKTISIMAMLLLSIAIVSATDTYIVGDNINMGYNDVRYTDFCISGTAGQGIDIVVSPVCKDLNGMYGCQAGDDMAVSELFTVVANPTAVSDGECTVLTLTSTIADPEDSGIFYYTVNGQVGGTNVGAETGRVEIPEFSTLGAGMLLLGLGIFISRKRK